MPSDCGIGRTAGSTDPGTFNNAVGAVGQYNSAIAELSTAEHGFMLATGEFTDELSANTIGTSPGSVGATGTIVDARLLPEIDYTLVTPRRGDPGEGIYIELNRVRAAAAQGRGALAQFAPSEPNARRGHMFAIEGYSEIMLAELFCSGVPLSTVDYGKDFTYQPGSTTVQVYNDAVALFDSALVLATDSAQILNLARVGKGRALLAIGKYDEAASAVASVPLDFEYSANYNILSDQNSPFQATTVSDREGGAGLPFRSGGDPRTAAVFTGTNTFGVPLFAPEKYPVGAIASFVVASGVEAELIRAEAALRGGDATTWLSITNALRTDGTFTFAPRANPQTAADSAAIDTTWGFGAGRVPGQVSGVRPMADPGTPTARLDSLFTDRAAWLFLTGHRQGDVRRRVRNDGVPANSVYPHGAYFGASGSYGGDVNFPIPWTEHANPLYKGCIDRNA